MGTGTGVLRVRRATSKGMSVLWVQVRACYWYRYERALGTIVLWVQVRACYGYRNEHATGTNVVWVRVRVRACYGYGYEYAMSMDTGIEAGIDVKFL